jgi:hypothetical protein
MLAWVGLACGGPAASTDGTRGARGNGSGARESGGGGSGASESGGSGAGGTGGTASGGAPGAGGAGGTVNSCAHEGETEPVLSCRDNSDCGGGYFEVLYRRLFVAALGLSDPADELYHQLRLHTGFRLRARRHLRKHDLGLSTM